MKAKALIWISTVHMSRVFTYFSTLFDESFYTQVDAIIASPHPEAALSFGSFGEYFPEGSRTSRGQNWLLNNYIETEKSNKKPVPVARELEQLKSSGLNKTK